MIKPIPTAFWKELSQREFDEIMERGGKLNAMQCLRVYQLRGDTGPVPTEITCYVKKKGEAS